MRFKALALAILMSATPAFAADTGHAGHHMPAATAPAAAAPTPDAAMQQLITQGMDTGAKMMKDPVVLDHYNKVMNDMHHAMMVKPTGNVDVDFIAGMIPHHQGAIDMAKIVIEKGKDPEVKALAIQIISAQEKEIAFMQEWLKKYQSGQTDPRAPIAPATPAAPVKQ